MKASAPKLIVGLGNPGERYRRTRHNVGFRVVQALAERLGVGFSKDGRLDSYLAEGVIEAATIEEGSELNLDPLVLQRYYLLLPTTFMNLSGQAVGRAMARYGLSFDQLMVVVDDVYLPVGTLRLRLTGSSGGHNGLKSIEALGTRNYARLKIGVGPYPSNESEEQKSAPERIAPEPLERFVLSPFAKEHERAIEEVIGRSVAVLECWLKQGIDEAKQLVQQ